MRSWFWWRSHSWLRGFLKAILDGNHGFRIIVAARTVNCGRLPGGYCDSLLALPIQFPNDHAGHGYVGHGYVWHEYGRHGHVEHAGHGHDRDAAVDSVERLSAVFDVGGDDGGDDDAISFAN